MNQDADQGFYGANSLTWRLSRHRVLLAGGPRALLLQLAHPLVAAGVADHSSFASDPVARLRRTLDSTLAIVFGATAEAERAIARINAAHARVRGTLKEPSGRFAAGTPYDATDPELAMWVHATLVDTTLRTYQAFVEPLRPDQLSRAYEESKIAARLLGVPDEVLPGDIDAFRAYFDAMIASDAIAVAPFQRELAQHVLYPRLTAVPRSAHLPTVAITTALLPRKVRDEYGLELTPTRRRIFQLSASVVRGILPLLPKRLKEMPHARRADQRGVGTSGGTRPSTR